MKNRSFSLVELMVMMAVFLILASLLSPSVTKMLRAAHEMKCGSSTRDLLMVTHIYADDADGYFMDLAKQPTGGVTSTSPYWTSSYCRL